MIEQKENLIIKSKRHKPTYSVRDCCFCVEGRVKLEQPDSRLGELKLSAYLFFDRSGDKLNLAGTDSSFVDYHDAVGFCSVIEPNR